MTFFLSSHLPPVTLQISPFPSPPFSTWSAIRSLILTSNRTTEPFNIPTARVHLIISDLTVLTIPPFAFEPCCNLVSLTAPSVTSIHRGAFVCATNVRDIKTGVETVYEKGCFFTCFALEAVDAGFNCDIGDRYGQGYWNDPTSGISLYLQTRSLQDVNREVYKTCTSMMELCNRRNGEGRVRAHTEDGIFQFLAGPGRDVAEKVLEFKCGVKVGHGDLRDVSPSELLAIGLEIGALKVYNNMWNIGFWGVIVDEEGREIEGGIWEAVGRNLITEGHMGFCWGLFENASGNVFDKFGIYGELEAVVGRIVNGMVIAI